MILRVKVVGGMDRMIISWHQSRILETSRSPYPYSLRWWRSWPGHPRLSRITAYWSRSCRWYHTYCIHRFHLGDVDGKKWGNDNLQLIRYEPRIKWSFTSLHLNYKKHIKCLLLTIMCTSAQTIQLYNFSFYRTLHAFLSTTRGPGGEKRKKKKVEHYHVTLLYLCPKKENKSVM